MVKSLLALSIFLVTLKSDERATLWWNGWSVAATSSSSYQYYAGDNNRVLVLSGTIVGCADPAFPARLKCLDGIWSGELTTLSDGRFAVRPIEKIQIKDGCWSWRTFDFVSMKVFVDKELAHRCLDR